MKYDLRYGESAGIFFPLKFYIVVRVKASQETVLSTLNRNKFYVKICLTLYLQLYLRKLQIYRVFHE
jgi:hypothetical protein